MAIQVGDPIDSLSLVDETAIETGDTELIFTKEQFQNFDHNFIRNLAANANTDCVNGKSNRLELQSFFVRQRSLKEYE